MAIDPTQQSSGGQATDGRAQKAQNKLANDMDMFLKMLTTQLKNQDPLSPLDSTEFTNQLVQFAAVEQQIDANAHLESLVKAQQSSQMASSVGYLGTAVEFESTSLPLQNGAAAFSYALNERADEVTVRIQDASGKTVRTIDGGSTAGRHDITWDGVDDNGQQLTDGAYKAIITAKNGQKTSTVTPLVSGTVTGITSGDGKVILSLSGVEVSLDDIKSVKQPASPATGT